MWRSGGLSFRFAGVGGGPAVVEGMKRIPAVIRELLMLVLAMAVLFAAFAVAFPTTHA